MLVAVKEVSTELCYYEIMNILEAINIFQGHIFLQG